MKATMHKIKGVNLRQVSGTKGESETLPVHILGILTENIFKDTLHTCEKYATTKDQKSNLHVLLQNELGTAPTPLRYMLYNCSRSLCKYKVVFPYYRSI